ncbi:MAG TPA: nuclear transport factor 2 family protein [Acidimicrobiia bacterium]|jgi:ketosteroid isomerase-like protein
MEGGWEAEQVVRRVARCADRSDVAGMMENFTADAVLDVGGRETEGRDAIFEFFGGEKATPTENERTKHVLTNTLVDDDGDALVTTSYFTVLRSWGIANWGRYVDRLVADGGSWKIARRTVVVDGNIPRPETPPAS